MKSVTWWHYFSEVFKNEVAFSGGCDRGKIGGAEEQTVIQV